MKVLPSVEALSDPGDERLLAELEAQRVLEQIARVRAFVERADRLLTTVVAGGGAEDVSPDDAGRAGELYAKLLAIVRKKQRR